MTKLPGQVTTTRKRWFERLANWLEHRGRSRMIYRERDRKHHPSCGTYCVDTIPPQYPCDPRCRVREGPIIENYLERFYILSTPWLGIYLHRFWASDDDGLHDHPWNSISILLDGVYHEEEPERQNVPYGPTVVRRRSPLHPLFKIRSRYAAHRITIDEEKPGAWSLFIRFGFKRRKWGFYRNRRWEAATVQSRKEENVSG